MSRVWACHAFLVLQGVARDAVELFVNRRFHVALVEAALETVCACSRALCCVLYGGQTATLLNASVCVEDRHAPLRGMNSVAVLGDRVQR